MRDTVAKVWLGTTATLVVLALALQIPSTAGDEMSFFTSPTGRVVNLFFYFTIVSNILVAVTCVLLIRRRLPTSPAFAVLVLAALVQIVVTGIVYRVQLAAEAQNTGVDAFTDALFHVVVPIMAVIGWLAFTPRRLVNARTVALSVIAPLTWVVVVLIRGMIVDWYPYPFVDVIEIGYLTAFLNVAVIAVFYGGLGLGALWLDHRLPLWGDAAGG